VEPDAYDLLVDMPDGMKRVANAAGLMVSQPPAA